MLLASLNVDSLLVGKLSKSNQRSHGVCETLWLKKTQSLQKEILPSDQNGLNICLEVAVLTCRYWFDWLDEVTQRIEHLLWCSTDGLLLHLLAVGSIPDLTLRLSFAVLSSFSLPYYYFFCCCRFLSASGDDGWNKSRWGGGERRGCRPQVWTGVWVHC